MSGDDIYKNWAEGPGTEQYNESISLITPLISSFEARAKHAKRYRDILNEDYTGAASEAAQAGLNPFVKHGQDSSDHVDVVRVLHGDVAAAAEYARQHVVPVPANGQKPNGYEDVLAVFGMSSETDSYNANQAKRKSANERNVEVHATAAEQIGFALVRQQDKVPALPTDNTQISVALVNGPGVNGSTSTPPQTKAVVAREPDSSAKDNVGTATSAAPHINKSAPAVKPTATPASSPAQSTTSEPGTQFDATPMGSSGTTSTSSATSPASAVTRGNATNATGFASDTPAGISGQGNKYGTTENGIPAAARASELNPGGQLSAEERAIQQRPTAAQATDKPAIANSSTPMMPGGAKSKKGEDKEHKTRFILPEDHFAYDPQIPRVVGELTQEEKDYYELVARLKKEREEQEKGGQ
jgi:hypothetical protein